MPNQHIRLKTFGTSSLLVEWPSKIARQVAREVIGLHRLLADKSHWGILETVPAYHSLLVEYDVSQTTAQELEDRLMPVIANSPASGKPGKLWEIPVTYEGLDLEDFSRKKRMKVESVIQLHSAPEYLVYFIGFLPGFLYLGDLPEALYLPRRSAPRPAVPKGAVAIGGQQTGIYPQSSPGGWHLIGQTDFEWFDQCKNPPSDILPGDRIKFIPQ